MEYNVKRIFDEECSDLKIDNHLVKRISDFAIGFVNKNEAHMTFFGGNTTGVQIVRFTTQDKEKWFNEVIQADDITLEERVLQLPTINKNFHISSDIFNLSVVWIIHSIMNSHHLNDKQKDQGMMNAALSLQYKFLTSILFQYYRYPADPELAAAAYAQMSYKFAIKQYGSWSATLVARCEDLLSPQGIHYKTFKKFDNDIEIVYTLNDTQGRIRDMSKNIFGELDKVKNQGIRIKTTSALIEIEGEKILKDKSKSLIVYSRYIHSIITDKNSFIKEDLLEVINKIMSTTPPKQLVKTLEWSSANYRHGGNKDIDELISLVLTHSFDYLDDNQNLMKETNNVANLLARLRGIYTSSRSSEKTLLEIREKAEDIVRKATHIRNDSIVSSLRTAMCLYIVLRAFSMHRYS